MRLCNQNVMVMIRFIDNKRVIKMIRFGNNIFVAYSNNLKALPRPNIS